MLRGEGSSTTELVPTTRPAASMAARASFWRSPTTAGTATGLGPVLTTRLTAEPSVDLAAGRRIGLHREPGGHVGVAARVGGPDDEAGAADGGHGVGLGQAVDLGHDGERRPGADGVVDDAAGGHLGAGLGGLGEDGVARRGVVHDRAEVPTTRPAASMAARASFWRSPTMAGTATGLGPVLTTRLTAEPSSTSLPAGGSVFTASPAGTLALLRASVAPTTRPAPRWRPRRRPRAGR